MYPGALRRICRQQSGQHKRAGQEPVGGAQDIHGAGHSPGLCAVFGDYRDTRGFSVVY